MARSRQVMIRLLDWLTSEDRTNRFGEISEVALDWFLYVFD